MLDTTALVHESYIRFAESNAGKTPDWPSLLHYAPRIMHNIVVDSIRRRNAEIHGGGAAHLELDAGLSAPVPSQDKEIATVAHALEQLETVDTHLAQVVEMRFFYGMTEQEMASALGISERTVRRNWEKARLLLAQILRHPWSDPKWADPST